MQLRTTTHLSPSADQPGSLLQQFAAITAFLSEPQRNANRVTAWRYARWRAMPHSRQGERE